MESTHSKIPTQGGGWLPKRNSQPKHTWRKTTTTKTKHTTPFPNPVVFKCQSLGTTEDMTLWLNISSTSVTSLSEFKLPPAQPPATLTTESSRWVLRTPLFFVWEFGWMLHRLLFTLPGPLVCLTHQQPPYNAFPWGEFHRLFKSGPAIKKQVALQRANWRQHNAPASVLLRVVENWGQSQVFSLLASPVCHTKPSPGNGGEVVYVGMNSLGPHIWTTHNGNPSTQAERPVTWRRCLPSPPPYLAEGWASSEA